MIGNAEVIQQGAKNCWFMNNEAKLDFTRRRCRTFVLIDDVSRVNTSVRGYTVRSDSGKSCKTGWTMIHRANGHHPKQTAEATQEFPTSIKWDFFFKWPCQSAVHVFQLVKKNCNSLKLNAIFKLLELNLEVCTLIISWLFDLKFTGIVYKSKTAKHSAIRQELSTSWLLVFLDICQKRMFQIIKQILFKVPAVTPSCPEAEK